MRKRLGKGLAIGIILLFLILSFSTIPSASAESESESTTIEDTGDISIDDIDLSDYNYETLNLKEKSEDNEKGFSTHFIITITYEMDDEDIIVKHKVNVIKTDLTQRNWINIIEQGFVQNDTTRLELDWYQKDVPGNNRDNQDSDNRNQTNARVTESTSSDSSSETDSEPSEWKIVNYLRDYYQKFDIAPMIRKLCKETGFKLKYIYELFPSGPAKGACKLAGVPKPTGCV